MYEKLKHNAWSLIRPIHSPVTRALRRRLGRNYSSHPEMELPPPYDSVQLDVERHLHDYLHVSPNAISQIVIVGAHEADEVDRLHRSYPQAGYLCFEPNPGTYARLIRKFQSLKQVTLRKLALSEKSGKAQFYELDMPGNGSLLEPDIENWSNSTQWKEKKVAAFDVDISTLDLEAAGLPVVDLLWMDVQGAEGQVLAGAAETLKRTKAVFIEVALTESPYKGAALYPQISARLQADNFVCVGLGIDAWNGTGNAFFVRDLEKLVGK